MFTDCQIRVATDADSADFLVVYQRIFPEKNITAQSIADIKNEPATVFVVGSPIRGFLYFWTLLDEIQIIDLGVLPEFRRQGIAQKLLEHLKSQITTDQQIFLEVRASNTAAMRLYEENGFQKISERKKYYADGEDAWVYNLSPR